MEQKRDVGLYGLAVIGSNLARNILDHGTSLAAYSKDEAERLALSESCNCERLTVCSSEEELVASLSSPRKIILVIKAGEAVDEVLSRLIPLLESGDIVVDGGNSSYLDSGRRQALCCERGIRFVGMGISGGAEGARCGPSLMPGGDPGAWPELKPFLESIAAVTPDGKPCVAWMGPGGSGHFVKMVHNAIEYADMELIAESYQLLRNMLKASPDEIRTVYADWNKTELSSYLIGITADVFGLRDEDGEALVDKVLDAAEQKGTGVWAIEAALSLGVPSSILAEAVFARSLSSLKDERVTASAMLTGSSYAPTGDRRAMIEELRRALLAGKILAYAEGFMLLKAASKEFGWALDLTSIALVWRAGCIIRSPFLDDIAAAYRRDPSLSALFLDAHFKSLLDQSMPALRKVTARSIEAGVPVPAFSSALSLYDGYRSTWLPANLIQALRDRFGEHGYERIDRPRGERFHSDWR